MQEIHRNTFEAGLDTNISKNLISANKYIDATNVNLVSSNNFFVLENIKGTTKVKEITEIPNLTVLATFATKYKIGNTMDVPCLTVFTARDLGLSSTFNIFCYDTRNSVLYQLYEEIFDGTSYFSTSPCIDGIVYPETGIDILYFTDNFFEVRKLRCEIPISYTSNFLNLLDLKLLQHGANGSVQLASIVEDAGSLFCGSYQIAYQLVNPETNQFTKFSLFSNPIQIYLKATFVGDNDIRSGVGVQSGKKILLTITPSTEELNYYTHFRLAVIENIEPSGVLVEKAYLTQLEAVSTYLAGSALISVPYAANIRLETLNLSEITVDKLAVDTIKTLAVRQNRIIGGNVTYKNLDYNNGTPSIGSGSILKQGGSGSFDNLFSDPTMSSLYRGYFRDEVYRFAISYFDEDGNFSFPQVLDLSSVTNNQITGSYKDMKFPDRSQKLGGTTYTLFKNADGIQSLGLRLNSINNHPTWARGFVILRAERIKNILFQTPIVPMNEAYGVGALENYPAQGSELSGTTNRSVSYPDASPMGPFKTYIPRNYFWLVGADIKQFITSGGATGAAPNIKYTGEAFLAISNSYTLGMIFPPSYMFEDKDYNFSPSYKAKTIDAALLTLFPIDYSDLSIGSTTRGRNIKTSVTGTFHSLQDSHYYYDSNHNGGKSPLRSQSATLTASENFTNIGSGSSVGGLDVFKYDKLETPGISWGNKANINKCSVLKFGVSREEINSVTTLSFAGGAQVAKGISASQDFYLVDGSTPQTMEIVNILSGVSDSRYGRYETPHNFIFTGTIVTFSTGELATIATGGSLPKTVDVWGGDCYVSPHLFKITDTTYGVTNSEKFEGLGGLSLNNSVRSWERAFNDIAAADTNMSIPVPYKNVAQFIQVILESEYNAGVIDNEPVVVGGTVGSLSTEIPIYRLGTASESICRVPLTYQLNQNHKKTNSDKIFFIKDPLLSDNLSFNARFIYSDQKVYQTSIVGFDSFRVLNFHDLEETYGDLIKLQGIGDDLYAFQEKAISYVGIGERTLETTDALTLAVQSGTFIGNVILVDNNKGTQHIKSVLNTGNAIYFIDNINQSVNRLASRQIEVISEKAVASTFRTLLTSRLNQNNVSTIYDPIKKQLWFYHNGIGNEFCYIFDEARDMWIGRYGILDSTLLGGVYTNQQLYLIGKEDTNLVAASMYTGAVSNIFGINFQPYVTYVVNPKMEIGKVFDDVLVVSSDRLFSLDATVNRELLLGNQIVTGITLDVTSRGEGNFRAKILRDSNNARLRGAHAIETLHWNLTGSQVQLASVLNKYRLSENRF